MLFDQPLTNTVEHVQLLPPEAFHKTVYISEGTACYSRNLPLVAFDQFKEAFVVDSTDLTPWFTPYELPHAQPHASVWFSNWGSSCIVGNSGSPVFVLINNELVLIGPWCYCDTIPWTGNLIDTLNTIIWYLDTTYLGRDSTYRAATYPLTGFPDLW
jgi:hypothetical protein